MNNKADVNTLGCSNCGADLQYKPGTYTLTCKYCNTANEIPQIKTEIKEFDFKEYLAKEKPNEVLSTESYVKCTTCGASSTLLPNITSASCPYCTTPLIIEQTKQEQVIQPNALLPFALTNQEAKEKFKEWINSLWFAPNLLKKATLNFNHFKGVYIPFWIYDAQANTQYVGQQGNYYYKTETYKAFDNGVKKIKTRQVKKTRWHSVTGAVTNVFDDALVVASKTVAKNFITDIDYWDLDELLPYNKSYLSGFITEKYQIDLAEGFQHLQKNFDPEINNTIRKDIGGNTQNIISKRTSYTNIKFKYILLPVFVCAYSYKGKIYQFLINGTTGDVQGKRPYSWLKIVLTSLVALIVITLLSIAVYHYTK